MSKTVFMRGLQNFIQDIRACQNKEQEQKRVEKELSKIREKFGDDKGLSGYDTRKYVWKLLYIHMLGYNITFGHKQACDLIPKPKYKDKQVGYMACSILLHENDEFLRLAINGVHSDMISRNEAFECLALSFAGSVGGKEMAEAVVPDILKLLGSGTSRPLVKKRAALCLLRMIKKTASGQPVVNPDSFCIILTSLLEERDLGLLLSSVTLLAGILARNGPAGYEPCQPRLIRILERLTASSKGVDTPAEYLYYGLPSPWLQSKCLRALQYFQVPELPADRAALISILQTIVDNPSAVEGAKGFNPNKSNAVHAIMFEAITLVLHLDTDQRLVGSSLDALGRLLSSREPNIKYLSLDTLARLAVQPDVVAAVRHHRPVVTAALRDADIAVRKRAMDVLFSMCDPHNVDELVGELLQQLQTAEFAMKEDLVLKIAILAEKFAPSAQWYVDTALQLMERAGDFVSEDIWQQAVQLVTNNESIQQYAARSVVYVLKRGTAHEALVCTAAYVVGEYGRTIQHEVPPAEQFRLLNALMPTASQTTKGLLMTALLKIYLLAPQDQVLRAEVLGQFERFKKMMEPEMQQRAAEYLSLADKPQAAVDRFILPMPKWPERPGILVRELQKREGADGDAALQHAAVATQGSGNIMAAPSPYSPQQLLQQQQQQQAASFDLLGEEALMGPSVPASSSAPASRAAPPSNTVDLLSDLLSDAVVTSPAPAPPAHVYPAPAHGDGFTAAAAMAPMSGFPPAAMVPGAGYPHAAMAPPAAYQSGATGLYPPPIASSPLPSDLFGPMAAQPAAVAPAASSSNPFAVSWPAAAPPAGLLPGQQAAPVQAGAPAGWGAGAATGWGAYPEAHQALAPPPTAMPPPAVQAFPAFPPAPAALGPREAVAPGAFGAPVAAQFDDPFGDAAFGPPVPAPALHFEPAQPIGDIQAWFTALMYKDRGVLYEDQYLQVGVQSRYSNGQADFVLFLGNKNTEHELRELSVSVTSSTSVQAAAAPAPDRMAPKQQLQVPIKLTCMDAVVDVPSVSIGYVLGDVRVRQQLHIPVGNHRFLVPDAAIAKELFFEEWKLNGSPPNKAQEMVIRDTPLSSESVISVMRQANLGVEHGYLDPSPNNEAGAGYFVCGAPNAERRVLVMCRIEGNPQNMAQFRVTVESKMPAVSNSTKDLLVSRLTSLPA